MVSQIQLNPKRYFLYFSGQREEYKLHTRSFSEYFLIFICQLVLVFSVVTKEVDRLLT